MKLENRYPIYVDKAVELPTHPAADLYRKLDDDDRDTRVLEIAESIQELGGIKQPVITFQGQVLDGRNRIAALKLAVDSLPEGWTEAGFGVDVPVQEFIGTETEAWNFAAGANIYRRHLTPGERAEAIVVTKKHLDALYAEARDIHAEAVKEAKATGAPVPPAPPKPPTATEMAQRADVSESTVSRVGAQNQKLRDTVPAAASVSADSPNEGEVPDPMAPLFKVLESVERTMGKVVVIVGELPVELRSEAAVEVTAVLENYLWRFNGVPTA